MCRHVGNAYRIEFKNHKKEMSKKEQRVRDIYGYTEKAAAARDAQFDIQEAQLSPDSSWPPKTEYFSS